MREARRIAAVASLINLALLLQPALAYAGDSIFSDGFEFGVTCATWSSSSGIRELCVDAPHLASPTPSTFDLEEEAQVAGASVYLLVDRSGGMTDEVSSLAASLTTVVDALLCAPAGSGSPPNCLTELDLGLGGFGFSGNGGQPFTHLEDIGTPVADVASAMPGEVINGCCSETLSLAAWAAWTGESSTNSGCSPSNAFAARTNCDASPKGSDGIGYPCFDPEQARWMVLFTDEAPTSNFDCPPLATVAGAAVAQAGRLAGVFGSNPGINTQTDLETLADSTDTQDDLGMPIVVSGAGNDAAAGLQSALLSLLTEMPVDATARVSDDPNDGVDTVTEFVASLEALQLGNAACTDGHTTADQDAVAAAETYLGLTPATPVCWRATFSSNTSVPSNGSLQVFLMTLQIHANGSRLDRLPIGFVVPP